MAEQNNNEDPFSTPMVKGEGVLKQDNLPSDQEEPVNMDYLSIFMAGGSRNDYEMEYQKPVNVTFESDVDKSYEGYKQILGNDLDRTRFESLHQEAEKGYVQALQDEHFKTYNDIFTPVQPTETTNALYPKMQ
jgi:hypothetical protein